MGEAVACPFYAGESCLEGSVASCRVLALGALTAEQGRLGESTLEKMPDFMLCARTMQEASQVELEGGLK